MSPARWTLRARLVMAMLALTTVALVLCNVIGIALLSDSLLKRVDEQLNGLGSVGFKMNVTPAPPLPLDFMPLNAVITKRVASVARIYVYAPGGALVSTVPDASQPGPDLGDIHADIRSRIPGVAENGVRVAVENGVRVAVRSSEPYTVPGTEGPSWRVKAVATSDGGTVVVAQSLAEVEQTRTSLTAIALAVSALVLLLLGLVADAVVRLGLRPLTRMERTAGKIARGDFARRVPAPDPHTEAGRLGRAMNIMLDRVESEIAARTDSESRMRRFLADASHELRTPLTSVRGFAELHRRGGGDTDEMMGRIESEAARMGVLVNDLLTLAQLDQERPLDRRPVDLLEIAADTIRDARARLPGRQVRLAGLGDTLVPVSVTGDEARLRQVAVNLVGNALAHTPDDASVTVRVGRRGGTAVLEVTDTGPGVPPEHVPHIFDRLYRVGQGRSRADGGAGLGLAIVSAIVRAHGGDVELDTAPGEGATFRVLLPGSEAAPSSL
ncbi:sensor histidine kinase [Nonomuraea lactucae]|uniref:sensor histidine kinase n=1 Tax=Nonomuraea lactucae TaxID=2249762 RepID=UPI001964ACDF|nr:HAMP domain-containing sensor histidine kinase [Nonomuraea lactucae]